DSATNADGGDNVTWASTALGLRMAPPVVRYIGQRWGRTAIALALGRHPTTYAISERAGWHRGCRSAHPFAVALASRFTNHCFGEDCSGRDPPIFDSV